MKSNPKPVVPIDVLSQITTLSLINVFLITTLFLIMQFFPISTPLPITQLLNIFEVLWIIAFFEMYELFIKLKSSKKSKLSSWIKMKFTISINALFMFLTRVILLKFLLSNITLLFVTTEIFLLFILSNFKSLSKNKIEFSLKFFKEEISIIWNFLLSLWSIILFYIIFAISLDVIVFLIV